MPKCHKINCLQKQILPILFQNNTERNKTRLKGYLWPRWNLQTESKQFKCKLKRRVSTRKKTRKLKKQADERITYRQKKRLTAKKSAKTGKFTRERSESELSGHPLSLLSTQFSSCSLHKVIYLPLQLEV